MTKHIANILTGCRILGSILLLFLPLTISFVELKYTAIAACSIATLSAMQEGFYIIVDRECR